MMSSPMVNTDARAAPPASAKATAMTKDPAPIFKFRIYAKTPTTLSWQPGEPARGRILHGREAGRRPCVARGETNSFVLTRIHPPFAFYAQAAGHRQRSEEHTSELQSHLNLVCRLLL